MVGAYAKNREGLSARRADSHRGGEGPLEHQPAFLGERPRALLAPLLGNVAKIADGYLHGSEEIDCRILLLVLPDSLAKRNDLGHATRRP